MNIFYVSVSKLSKPTIDTCTEKKIYIACQIVFFKSATQRVIAGKFCIKYIAVKTRWPDLQLWIILSVQDEKLIQITFKLYKSLACKHQPTPVNHKVYTNAKSLYVSQNVSFKLTGHLRFQKKIIYVYSYEQKLGYMYIPKFGIYLD